MSIHNGSRQESRRSSIIEAFLGFNYDFNARRIPHDKLVLPLEAFASLVIEPIHMRVLEVATGKQTALLLLEMMLGYIGQIG